MALDEMLPKLGPAQLEATTPVSTSVKFRTASALVPVLLVLCAVTVPARGASPHGRLDRSFGHAGISTVAVSTADDQIEGFTVAADGRIYVLDGSSLLAFQSDGEVAGDFGEHGQITVAPVAGEGEPAGLAVDSRGRLLVAGTIQGQIRHYYPAYTAYVLRILPDGSRDPGFGGGGEVDTDFGLPKPEIGSAGPSVYATSIVVDARDRPVIGGSYGKTTEPCGLTIGGGPAPFVARLTAPGDIDKTFGKAGHTILEEKGNVMSLAKISGGGLAVFSRPCATPPRVETRSPLFTDLTGSGSLDSPARDGGLPFTWVAPAIDPNDRILELESPPPAAVEYEPDALVRFLPNGSPDPNFGRHGRVVLREPREVSAFAVDAVGRPIVASSTRGRTELRRFRLNGKLDRGFGRGGRMTAKVGAPSAITLDPRGRVYTVGLARNQLQTTVKVARFIPGR